MQAFCCEVVRARMKLGIAIAANRPMMATTIMISTSVKPLLREERIFIRVFLLSTCGVNVAPGGFIITVFVHRLPGADRACRRAIAMPCNSQCLSLPKFNKHPTNGMPALAHH